MLYKKICKYRSLCILNILVVNKGFRLHNWIYIPRFLLNPESAMLVDLNLYNPITRV